MPNTTALFIAAGEAQQDQEIAAGVAWYRSHDPAMMVAFFNQLNDDGPALMRRLADANLHVIRSLALIGFWEIAKRAALEESARA